MKTMTTTDDPVLAAIKHRLSECEGRVNLAQGRINVLAEELTEMQSVKRRSQNEVTNLRTHLDAHYPGWESETKG